MASTAIFLSLRLTQSLRMIINAEDMLSSIGCLASEPSPANHPKPRRIYESRTSVGETAVRRYSNKPTLGILGCWCGQDADGLFKSQCNGTSTVHKFRFDHYVCLDWFPYIQNFCWKKLGAHYVP